MLGKSKIYHTVYDGFFIVKNLDGTINCYEGYALCPKKIQDRIDANAYTELNRFCNEAIAFGCV